MWFWYRSQSERLCLHQDNISWVAGERVKTCQHHPPEQLPSVSNRVCLAACSRMQDVCEGLKLAAASRTRGALRCKSSNKGVGFLSDGGRKAGDFHRSKDGGRAEEERGARGRVRARWAGEEEVRWCRISHSVLPYFHFCSSLWFRIPPKNLCFPQNWAATASKRKSGI